MFNKQKIKEIGNRLGLWINEFNCKLKSMTNRILSMDEVLSGHKIALGKHAGRLKRQGADIYKLYRMIDLFKKQMLTRRLNEERFQKRLNENEKWIDALKASIVMSAECSGKLLSKHKRRLDEQGKGIDELSKSEPVENEDINRTVKDVKEIRDVIRELAEHLGFEITTERNKDYMKAYKVSITNLKAKTNERDDIERAEKKNR